MLSFRYSVQTKALQMDKWMHFFEFAKDRKHNKSRFTARLLLPLLYSRIVLVSTNSRRRRRRRCLR